MIKKFKKTERMARRFRICNTVIYNYNLLLINYTGFDGFS